MAAFKAKLARKREDQLWREAQRTFTPIVPNGLIHLSEPAFFDDAALREALDLAHGIKGSP